MKNKESLLTFIFGAITIIAWIFPNEKIEAKIFVSILAFLSIGLIYLKENLWFFFRRYLHEILSILLLAIFLILFFNYFIDLVLPASILLLTSITISLLISFKYKQGQLFKSRLLLKKISFKEAWNLNHWGGSYASIQNEMMIFTGNNSPHMTDGSHIDLNNILEIGKSYEITCVAKSSEGTTGLFQIWCHDNTGEEIHGSNFSTPFKIPSKKGDEVKLDYKAEYNTNIRIHLQYTPGQGQISLSDVKIYQLIN